jgi:hypothetical protein
MYIERFISQFWGLDLNCHIFLCRFQCPDTEGAMSGVVTKFAVTSMVMWTVPVAIVYGFYYQMIPGAAFVLLTVW